MVKQNFFGNCTLVSQTFNEVVIPLTNRKKIIIHAIYWDLIPSAVTDFSIDEAFLQMQITRTNESAIVGLSPKCHFKKSYGYYGAGACVPVECNKLELSGKIEFAKGKELFFSGVDNIWLGIQCAFPGAFTVRILYTELEHSF